jgi:hypothetical protein
MSTHRPIPDRYLFLAGVVVVLAAAGALASLSARQATAYPKSPVGVRPDFDRAGVLAAGGRGALVSGPVNCSKGYVASLRATISEGVSGSYGMPPGAVAQGSWSKRCTLKALHWQLTARVTDGTSLVPGCAQAAGLVIIRKRGKAVAAFQWLRKVVLSAPGTSPPKVSC